VPFSDDPVDFIQSALQPARVREVRLDEEGNATVIVNDAQLSLAIGKEGQNARLAARLTGWRIDIRSETQDADEAEIEYAEGEWVEEEGQMVWHPANDADAVAEADGATPQPAPDVSAAAPADAKTPADAAAQGPDGPEASGGDVVEAQDDARDDAQDDTSADAPDGAEGEHEVVGEEALAHDSVSVAGDGATT
jgi:N utilization substance protein A